MIYFRIVDLKEVVVVVVVVVVMYQQSPARPPGSAKPSKRMSPRGSLHKEKKSTDLKSYLNSLSHRKCDKPLDMTTILTPCYLENEVIKSTRGDYNYHRPNNIARKLFDKTTQKCEKNIADEDRYLHCRDNALPFFTSGDIILQHAVSKRGRAVRFIVREHNEKGETMFSVVVQGDRQRHNLNIPHSQVTLFQSYSRTQ